MSSLILPAPAKLNLFLHITGRRADGYHELQTLFQFVELADQITLTPTPSPAIELLTPTPGVADDDNLVMKAARLLQEATGYPFGAQLAIQKHIPMGAGLGGGSSDAATVLLGLNQLWGLGLNIEQLAILGLQLGADVPVFIHGKAAYAEGIGERLTPADPEENWYLIIRPDCSIDTSVIFQATDLPRNTEKLDVNHIDWRVLHNDCEKVVCKRYEAVEKAIKWLLEYAPSRMTGTGSCVFASFENADDARLALSHLPDNMEGFVTKGINNSPVHQQLGL